MPKRGPRATNRKKIGPSRHQKWNQAYQKKRASQLLEQEPKKARAILALKNKPVPATEISKRFNVPAPVITELFKQHGGRSKSVMSQIRAQAHKGKGTKQHRTTTEIQTRLGKAYRKRLLEYRRIPSQKLSKMLENLEEEARVLKEKMKSSRFNHDRKAYYSYRDRANRRQIRINAIKGILRERGLLE